MKSITLSPEKLTIFPNKEKQQKTFLQVLPSKEKKEDESWKLFQSMALDRLKWENNIVIGEMLLCVSIALFHVITIKYLLWARK